MSSTEEKLIKQIEFYFSDSNLVKDKFLRPLVDHDPQGYVDLDIICGFNRVKSISTDRSQIISVLKKSKLLVLNEEGTKLKRKTPYRDYDASARTVYVEDLPKGYNHDVVIQLFSKVGEVAYASLPRFQTGNKDFKGFAFIEFVSEELAQEAVRYFAERRAKSEDNSAPRVIMKADWERLTKSFKEHWRKEHTRLTGNNTHNNKTEDKEAPKKKEADKPERTEADGQPNNKEEDNEEEEEEEEKPKKHKKTQKKETKKKRKEKDDDEEKQPREKGDKSESNNKGKKKESEAQGEESSLTKKKKRKREEKDEAKEKKEKRKRKTKKSKND